jgi:hypothetical protein
VCRHVIFGGRLGEDPGLSQIRIPMRSIWDESNEFNRTSTFDLRDQPKHEGNVV